MRPLVLLAVLLASVLGSRGTTLAPSPAANDSPANQGQSSSPPEPAFALGPVTLPTVPPTLSASPPPANGAVSPAVPAEPQNPPSPLTPPKEYNAPPPIEVAPPHPTVEIPSPVAPPQAADENPTPILPGTPALLPSVQAPAPSAALNPNPPVVLPPSGNDKPNRPNPPVVPPPSVNDKPSGPSPPVVPPPSVNDKPSGPTPPVVPPPSANDKPSRPNPPVAPPPSVNDQPSRPVGSVPPYAPPAFSPPRNDIPPYPPKGSYRGISPSTSVPHVKPPAASPVIAQAPRQQPVSPSGSTVLPPSISPPANLKNHHVPHASPPKKSSVATVPVHKSPMTGSAPATSPLPQPHNTNMPSIPKNASSVSRAQPSPPNVAPKSPPTSRSHTRGWKSSYPKNGANPSSAPSYPPYHAQGPYVSRAPRQSGTRSQNYHAPPPMPQGHPSFPVHSPSPSPVSSSGPTNGNKRHHISPTLPPIPPQPEPKAPSAHPIWTLPPPPPNLDCNALACPEPLTDPPAGAPCACVLPIKVGIRLSVDLYSFFPLVSDFAEEVSSGVNMAVSQVRVMGANVAGDQPDKTVVLVNLVPMQVKFDNATAFSAFENLWSKKVSLKQSVFGDYEILYVVYPGLPPSPPPGSVGNGAFGNSRNARAMKPLGVDVSRRPQKKANGSLIAIAVLSAVIALIICSLAAWLLMLGFRGSGDMTQRFPHGVLPKFSRSSGTGQTLLAGRYSSPSGPSGSLGSSIATYTGQAKTFKFAEINKATNGFDDSKVLGEGGFGCVYQGTLEDGTRVAVKVLKRYDGQGEREFLAEVEMLGRLHHRNLVKLLGICVEENARCLVYELIPNGSVESHLHGVDRETAPLDWNARMKIALGAARALAYLHEDSNPCVIHRDFKSSNILLEHDFTPKVSDFGLARTARGEGNQHISTRVMGTFGYVAPEYAMTGHLLVKSDVYSYGVVLLELLTGRKPVDMSRPAGQENLVAWARPLLTNMLSLRQAVDPLLGPNVPLDNVAKAAAIASMCVQPEVAHRPSMGEVVQALKLVCSEGDDGLGSGRFSQELQAPTTAVYDATGIEAERVLLSEIFGSTPVFTPAADSGSFRKQSSSGPLMTGKNQKFWQRLRNLSRGSMSEHGVSPDYETRSQYSGR